MKHNYTIKRTLSAMLLLMMSSLTWAYDFEVDGIYYKKLSDTEVGVASNDYSYAGNIVIPSSVTYNYKTYNVTSIENQAFYICRSITSIFIPESVTSIGDYAFSSCSSLSSISIPKSVTGIGDYAFQGCSSLTAISIPEGVSSISNGVFSGCSSLTSIIIPESVTSIGVRAFYVCSGLTLITIPEDVTSIGEDAFNGCSSLTSITIPESVTSIGNGAFYGCSSNLTSIIVAEGNSKYDSRDSCNALIATEVDTLIIGCKETIIPEGIKKIGYYAFSGCDDITSMIIPEGVTSIGVRAFSECSNLTSVTIPNSVTSIEDEAFSGCGSLTSVICYAEKVPNGNMWTFYDVPTSEATLYVPASAIEDYKAASGWNEFGTILPIESDADGINTITAEQKEGACYTLDGIRVDNPTKKGIYIRNGKKVLVK